MEETNVASDAATENTASVETTNQDLEVVDQETQADDQQQTSESDDSDKALKRMQRRIDKRTADVYRERAQREQLERRLAELESKQQPEEEKLDASAVERIAQQKAQELRAQEKFRESIEATLSAGSKLKGFNEACNALDAEIGGFYKGGKPSPFVTVVLESGPASAAKLLHHLGTNPEVAAELADLTPTQLARRLDRIERDLSEQAKPKTSSAPKPLDPVKGQGGSKDPSQMSDREFAEWRKAQIAQRR